MGKKKVLIDGGSNAAIGLNYASMGTFDTIYAFEPNPRFFTSYIGLSVTLIRKAIWIEDCEVPFYLCKQENQHGSSLFKNKLSDIRGRLVSFLHEEPITVGAVDFSRWLGEHFMEGDNEVWVKFDIEGAEYEVLRKMIRDGTIHLVDNLWVEYHWKKLGMPEVEHRGLVDDLTRIGLPMRYWESSIKNDVSEISVTPSPT